MKIAIILLLICNLISRVLSESVLATLTTCDYKKYPVNGCEDELGSDCDTTTSQCKCKPGNWVLVNNFCFPMDCPKGQYFDHNFNRCTPQRRATLNSEENYCRYDFHCRGDHTHCQSVSEWNYMCVCDRGFVYDTSTQECQLLKGLNGFCSTDEDCDTTKMRQLVCLDKSCQCAQGFTYNNIIDGCEDNERIKERDSQTRKMIYLFIGLGLFLGAALSISFASSHTSTEQLVLKRMIDQRRQQREQQRQQRLEQQELELEPQESQQSTPELDSDNKSVHLIDNRETA